MINLLKKTVITVLVSLTALSAGAIPEEIDTSLKAIAGYRKSKKIDKELLELEKLKRALGCTPQESTMILFLPQKGKEAEHERAVRLKKLEGSTLYQYYRILCLFLEADLYYRMNDKEKMSLALTGIHTKTGKESPGSFRSIMLGNQQLKRARQYLAKNSNSYMNNMMLAFCYLKMARNHTIVSKNNPEQFEKFVTLCNLSFWNDEIESSLADLEQELSGYTPEQLDSVYVFNVNLMAGKRDYEERFLVFDELASRGHLEAHVELAKCYESGIGTEINKSEAFRLYKMTAEQGSSNGQLAYGRCLMDGIGTEPDYRAAYNLFAAHEGTVEFRRSGAYYMAVLFENGWSVAADTLKALDYYMVAAEDGYSKNIKDKAMKAHRSLFDKYEEGSVLQYVTSDDKSEKRMDNINISESKSDSEMSIEELYEAALYYEDLNNMQMARHYFESGAEKKDPKAMYKLALIYKNEKNYTQAAFHFRTGAGMNDRNCMAGLSLLLVAGQGVDPDMDAAGQYAEKSGSKEAMEYVKEQDKASRLCIWGKAAYNAKEYKKALYYFERGSLRNHIESSYYAGNIYYRGLSITKDYDKALFYFRKALPYGWASLSLGEMYEKGLGVNEDPKEAEKYYKMARKDGIKVESGKNQE
ncbi:MAG: sel1 repeat family protein [Tannerella sp.]|nr:sel1 repeat family protein [Tannerella sp.]